MINFAPQFKKVYENYAKNNPKYSHLINNKKLKFYFYLIYLKYFFQRHSW